MANVYNESVYIIDTPSATNIVGTGERVRVQGIRWVATGATAGTTKAEIANGSGQVLWESYATGTTVAETSNIAIDVRGGLRVPTLGAGKLYLYIAP